MQKDKASTGESSMIYAAELRITIEQLRAIFTYDSATGQFYKKASGLCRPAGAPIGYRCRGYIILRVGNKQMKAHRVAWAMHYGQWPRSVVDHINREKNDNRIANLRECNFAQNTQNSCRKPGVCGLKGVHKGVHVRDGNVFRAQITTNGVRINLGRYKTAEEAHQVYRAAALIHHGEFANFEKRAKTTTGEAK